MFNAPASTSNWTRVNCTWLDEVYEVQNHFYWQHRGETRLVLLYCLVCFIGLLFNLIVLLAFARSTSLRANLRNYFIANLAVSDLFLCTITAPATLYLTTNLFWPFGSAACQLLASAQAVNMFVSCLTLVLIALDRVLLTICPIKWRLAATAPIICYFVVWFMSLLVAMPYFFAVNAEDVQLDPWDKTWMNTTLALCGRSRPQICLEKTWHRLPFSRQSYTLAVLAVQYLLPVFALAFSYSQIGHTIQQRVKTSTTLDRQRRQHMNQRNRRALVLLLLLVIVYAIAWLPINAYHMLNSLEYIEFSQYKRKQSSGGGNNMNQDPTCSMTINGLKKAEIRAVNDGPDQIGPSSSMDLNCLDGSINDCLLSSGIDKPTGSYEDDMRF